MKAKKAKGKIWKRQIVPLVLFPISATVYKKFFHRRVLHSIASHCQFKPTVIGVNLVVNYRTGRDNVHGQIFEHILGLMEATVCFYYPWNIFFETNAVCKVGISIGYSLVLACEYWVTWCIETNQVWAKIFDELWVCL